MSFGWFLFALVIISIPVAIKVVKPKPALRNYVKIQPGMSEADVIGIMGERYNKGFFEDGRIELEWRVNAVSSEKTLGGAVGTSNGSIGGGLYAGESIKEDLGVSKVTVVFREDKVVEVRPHNVYMGKQ